MIVINALLTATVCLLAGEILARWIEAVLDCYSNDIQDPERRSTDE